MVMEFVLNCLSCLCPYQDALVCLGNPSLSMMVKKNIVMHMDKNLGGGFVLSAIEKPEYNHNRMGEWSMYHWSSI